MAQADRDVDRRALKSACPYAVAAAAAAAATVVAAVQMAWCRGGSRQEGAESASPLIKPGGRGRVPRYAAVSRTPTDRKPPPAEENTRAALSVRGD
jgi:hypothetical protein